MTETPEIPTSYDDPLALAEALVEPPTPAHQRAALDWAYHSPDLAGPIVADVLRLAVDRVDSCVARGESVDVALRDVCVDAAWMAALLAADLELAAVKPSLERLLGLEPAWVEALFGDMITEHGAEMIAGCCGGDVEWCLSFAADPRGFWVQVAALVAVEHLGYDGVISIEDAAARIAARLVDDRSRSWRGSRGETWDAAAWNANLVGLLCDLDPNPFRGRIEALFDADLIDQRMIGETDVEACLETPGLYRRAPPFERLAEHLWERWQAGALEEEQRALRAQAAE